MVQTAEMRERMFTMRLSVEEGTRLDALAGHYGINGAGVIRMLLKEKARELGVESEAVVVPPKKTTKKR